MNASKINEWLTLISNFGVLLGITFLAYEIQQNTLTTQAQTRDSITEKQMTFYDIGISNPDALELFLRGNANELEPGTLEFTRYLWIIRSQTRMWENEWYQAQLGTFESEEFQARLCLWSGALNVNSIGYKNVWSRIRDTYAPEFREVLDDMANSEDYCL